MALVFGWSGSTQWESIWQDDEALGDVPDAVLEEWEQDGGDAKHLRPYVANGKPPTVIALRSLTLDEIRLVQAIIHEAETPFQGVIRGFLLCFRLGVTFPGLPKTIPDPKGSGADHPVGVKERGFRMLSEPFCSALEAQYPGIISFYGDKIYQASVPTEPEKKASSPRSTRTKSASGTGRRSKAGAARSA